MLKRVAAAVAALVVALAILFFAVTAPQTLAEGDLPAHRPDPARGEQVFWAAGCASCHADPQAEGDDRLRLPGGREIASDFGTFRVPNISPDPDTGIGGWSVPDFVNAVMQGVAPSGAHYYPAFPYASYVRMRVEDAIDLKAFMDTLPPVENRVAGHDLAFPYSIRRAIGVWKRLYLDAEPQAELAAADAAALRGRYIVEALAHCGECHTPRTALGGLRGDAWLAGAPNPDGDGTIPNITPSGDGIGGWSADDIAYALESGFTPDFDTLSGSMGEVVQNMARLSDEDRAAIAAYLKAVPPLPDASGDGG